LFKKFRAMKSSGAKKKNKAGRGPTMKNPLVSVGVAWESTLGFSFECTTGDDPGKNREQETMWLRKALLALSETRGGAPLEKGWGENRGQRPGKKKGQLRRREKWLPSSRNGTKKGGWGCL